MKKEPALIVMAVAWVLGLGVEKLAPGHFDSGTIEAMAELLLFLGSAFLIRMKVFSEHTIRRAGFTPSQIESRAESPSIPTAVGH